MSGILQDGDEIEQLKKEFKALSEQKSIINKDNNCIKDQNKKQELILEHYDL
ncbi:MAG: hypothetical protein K2Y30_06620 [Flavobacteriaceae bacterium]|jgi:hypothetical protein|uniref:Uncharacterized protein n=1 Tax=Flavobacterium kayseriense TaxID=2764714 RepID=A0ABR7J6X4_9FLAO|nr:hypothetical protein [Flavobacterium kayseriense]MBC5841163.1 hypothetical protein [Flavobacterium kayseriense]MBC5847691.1 hypothetical protein [Flavobacterium kayseriense]MBU0939901.1 hypothetical protein [Bacteroidota bacterium]MBX9887590.1 hypothetical protein [Flavobacteriaceae bacterium]